MGTVRGSVDNTSGTVGPGKSPGILTVNGNYTQAANGSLALEIRGTEAGAEHDKLVVSGIADLAGTVTVELIDGFSPTDGDTYDVLDFASLVDNGISFDFDLADGPSGWDTSQFNAFGLLCFGTGTCGPGNTDFDDSGIWDLADLNLVLFNWQQDEASLPQEWVHQRPGTVGLVSLNLVLFNWQQASSSLAAVPEPSTAASLLLLLLLGVGACRRAILE